MSLWKISILNVLNMKFPNSEFTSLIVPIRKALGPFPRIVKKSLEVGFLTSLRFENVHEITILRKTNTCSYAKVQHHSGPGQCSMLPAKCAAFK